MRTSLRYSNISAYICIVFKGQTFTKMLKKKLKQNAYLIVQVSKKCSIFVVSIKTKITYLFNILTTNVWNVSR